MRQEGKAMIRQRKSKRWAQIEGKIILNFGSLEERAASYVRCQLAAQGTSACELSE